MKQYEIREHLVTPTPPWRTVWADTPANAIRNSLNNLTWYAEEGVTELVDVREVQPAPIVLALHDDGTVTEVI